MERILLVDDEPIFRMGLRSVISWEELGCQIVGEAKNGEEALLQIEEKKPDIVFLDIKMPKMDGIQVLEKRRRYEKNPRFVVLSCFNEYEYVREAMKLGAFDYLFKPLMEGKDIAAVIKEIQAQDNKGEQGEEQKKQQQISHALREVLDGGSEEQLFELCDLFEKYPYFLMEIRVPHGETKKSKRETMLTLAGEVVTGCFDEGMLPFLVKQEEKISGLFFFKETEGYELPSARKNLWKKVKEYIEIPVWISCSGIQRGKASLKRGIFEMQMAAEAHFFSCYGNKNEEYLEFKEWMERSYDLVSLYQKDYLKMRILFGEEKTEEINKCLQEICQSILKNEQKNVKDFSHFLADIIVGSMRYYDRRELLENLIMGEYDMISRLYHQETMEDCCNYFLMVLDRIFAENRKKEEQIDSRTATIWKVKKYLAAHYSEKLKLQDIADQFHLSVKYFCKIFKEETGETFVSYLTELRLKEAEKLLKTTELKTYEIAERTGFSDYHHFCKTFKKVTGKTPSDIRG